MSNQLFRNSQGMPLYETRETSPGVTEVRSPSGMIYGTLRNGSSYDRYGNVINNRNASIADILCRMDLSPANANRGF